MRLVGVNIPDDKRIAYALTLIYGIGWSRSQKILKELSIDENKKVNELNETQVKAIQNAIEKKIKVEGDLKEENSLSIKRFKEIGSYKGIRHAHGLPARGQRTRSNARTKRGKRKTVGAMKKDDMLRVQKAGNST